MSISIFGHVYVRNRRCTTFFAIETPTPPHPTPGAGFWSHPPLAPAGSAWISSMISWCAVAAGLLTCSPTSSTSAHGAVHTTVLPASDGLTSLKTSSSMMVLNTSWNTSSPHGWPSNPPLTPLNPLTQANSPSLHVMCCRTSPPVGSSYIISLIVVYIIDYQLLSILVDNLKHVRYVSTQSLCLHAVLYI